MIKKIKTIKNLIYILFIFGFLNIFSQVGYFPYVPSKKYNEIAFTSSDIKERGTKNIQKLISTTYGTTKNKDGQLSFKGNRVETMKYYIEIPTMTKPNISTTALRIYNNRTPAIF